MALSEAKCNYCFEDHLVDDCPKLKKEKRIEIAKQRNQDAMDGKPSRQPLVCRGCMGVGHTISECPSKGKSADKPGKGPSKYEKKQVKAFLAWQEAEAGKAAPEKETDSKPAAASPPARDALSPEQIAATVIVLLALLELLVLLHLGFSFCLHLLLLRLGTLHVLNKYAGTVRPSLINKYTGTVRPSLMYNILVGTVRMAVMVDVVPVRA